MRVSRGAVGGEGGAVGGEIFIVRRFFRQAKRSGQHEFSQEHRNKTYTDGKQNDEHKISRTSSSCHEDAILLDLHSALTIYIQI